jgi:hypothetical protein
MARPVACQDYRGPCGRCDNDRLRSAVQPGPETFPVGERVVSERWGEGTVQRYDGDQITATDPRSQRNQPSRRAATERPGLKAHRAKRPAQPAFSRRPPSQPTNRGRPPHNTGAFKEVVSCRETQRRRGSAAVAGDHAGR